MAHYRPGRATRHGRQLAYKFPHKYKALADRPASRINPTRPSGSPRSISAGFIFQRFSVPSQIVLTIMAFSQIDVVASLGALLRWSRPGLHLCGCASGSVKHGLCNFVGDWDGEQDSSLKCKDPRFACSNFVFGD
jgi:hypothetical protein